MRLFLCESILRNKFYQIRRNTALYWAGGAIFMVVAIAGGAVALLATGAPLNDIAAFAAASGAFIILSGAVTARATSMMFNVVQSNEWSRFAMINLDRTIRDHVGEDKLQIVTFRDRNRME